MFRRLPVVLLVALASCTRSDGRQGASAAKVNTTAVATPPLAADAPRRLAAARPFSEGVARVWDSTLQTWGFIDSSGAFIMTQRFAGAGDFKSGRALVLVDSQFIAVDRTGVVVERLADAVTSPGAEPLPGPSDTVTSVEGYAEERLLSPHVYDMTVEGNPGLGSTYTVARLHFGALAVRESYNAGGGTFRVRIPRLTVEQAQKYLAKLRHGQPNHHDNDECGFEEWSVRTVRGVPEIVHVTTC